MWMEGGDLMLSGKAAAYAGGAAVAGGVASFLSRGDYKLQAFVQDIVGAVFGWCIVVTLSVVYRGVTEDPWVFAAAAFLSAYIAPALLKIVFWRIEHADVSVNFGPIKANSDGKEKDE